MKKNNTNKIINFGVHLTLDGYGGDIAKLNDKKLIYDCLSNLPFLIGMKKMMDPVVLEAPPVSEKDGGGFSGFVMINTSHISCHTFPKRRFISCDVYTCSENLNKNFVIKYFKDIFFKSIAQNDIIDKRAMRNCPIYFYGNLGLCLVLPILMILLSYS